MRFRKLRIAFSAVCGVICLLLLALWVRSQWRVDNLYVRVWGGNTLNVNSGLGQLAFVFMPRPRPSKWQFMSQLADPIRDGQMQRGYVPPTLKFMRTPVESALLMRLWIPVLTSGLLAALPWIQYSKRFSLRTLLIAMTLVALALGAVIYAAK